MAKFGKRKLSCPRCAHEDTYVVLGGDIVSCTSCDGRMQFTPRGAEIPEDEQPPIAMRDSPVPDGFFEAIVTVATAYYAGVNRDSSGERMLHNLGVAQAYDGVAENLEQLRGSGGRLALAKKLREVGKLASDGARSESGDRKTQSYGMSSGYLAIAEALESSDAVGSLRRTATDVGRATSPTTKRSKWFRR